MCSRHNEAAQAVNHATQSISLTPELKGSCLSKCRLQRQAEWLLTIHCETDGFSYEPLFSNRGYACICVSEYVYMCMSMCMWTGSLGAADVSEDTDVVQGDDVTQHGQGHLSSFTSSRGVTVWQIKSVSRPHSPYPPYKHNISSTNFPE